MWVGARGRVGLVATTLAAVLAFAVTWGAAAGWHGDAPRWASVLHTALADAQTLPVPFGLSAAQSFLTGSAIWLAVAALGQPSQPGPIVGRWRRRPCCGGRSTRRFGRWRSAGGPRWWWGR